MSQYTAASTLENDVAVIRLADAANGVELSILPSLGNRVYQMKVHGNDILYYPPGDLSSNSARFGGIPFLAPWADLLDEQAFWANGRRYGFNMTLGNVRGERPIHGLLSDSPLWQVVDVRADAHSAIAVSRLEFWKSPDLMAQWPFAHEYEMVHTLSDGVLQVTTTITNLSTDPMPVAIGFHPYFQIPGVPRDQWVAHLAARTHVVANEYQIPTGEMRPLGLPNPLLLGDRTLDDGFTSLARESGDRARFLIESSGKAVEILFGPRFPVATIYLPPREEFICIEPLSAIISGVNLAHRGKYRDLQILPAGDQWTESFWVRTREI